jgi:anti-anti-sigma factor
VVETTAPPHCLDVAIHHDDGGATVTMTGELDLDGVPDLRDALASLRHRYDGAQVTLECGDLSFVDAAGVDALVRAARAWGPDDRMVLRHARPGVTDVIAACGVTPWFDLD